MIKLPEEYFPPAPPPEFAPGDVVHHRRYNYRGVVADLDLTCQADTNWYQTNRTQPDRNQPWYHVLVHNAVHTTYVAKSNLKPDPLGPPIEHPTLNHFFDAAVINEADL